MRPTKLAADEFQCRVIEVDIHGKRGLEEYYTFVPETKELLNKEEKIRILAIMHDFDGWDAGSLWETAKWDAIRFAQIERVAVVGEKTWRECAMGFSKPFANAKVRYFTLEELDAARAWVNRSIDTWDESEVKRIKQP